MRTLDRFVLATFLKIFVVFVLTAPVLFVLGDVNEQLDHYVDRGLTAMEVLQAYVYMFPNFVMWSFPIAALVAAVFTVHGMTVHNEVVAAKAGGVSFHRLTAPIYVAGALLTLAALGLSEVVPRGNRRAGEITRREDTRRGWRSDFVFQTDHGHLLSVGRLGIDNNRLTRVVLEEAPEGPDDPAIHVIAAEAVWDTAGGGWTFERGHFRRLYQDGREEAASFQRLRAEGFDERPEDLLEEPREDEELTYQQMGRLAAIIERSGGRANKLRVKRHQRLAIPAATLVIILFGAPLSTSSKRGGAAFGVGVSLGTTILFILLLKIFGAFGASGTLDPFAAAWLPNAIFLVLGLWLLTRVRT